MEWSARLGFSAVAGTAAMLLLVGTAAAAARPGGQSIGDPYYPHDGNTGYRADHYGLRLTYQPGADKLAGTATIKATATQDLSRFSFDFALKASSVTVNGHRAAFSQDHRNRKLVITPNGSLRKKRHFTVVVRYSGQPGRVVIDGAHPWVATKDGAHSTAEPHIASVWFPCNDHPLNKATFDISVGVPVGTQAFAAGALVGTKQQGGRTWWTWHGSKPQATYLQILTIGHFTYQTSTLPGGVPFLTAYEKSLDAAHLALAKQYVEQTPKIIAYESTVFGPYPFDSEGGVVVNDNGSDDAEEFQSLPVYLSGNFDAARPPHVDNVYVVAHENAHQWFGDSVSVAGWKNIWLNEGFANYSEWLWSEHTGQGTGQQLFDQYYAQHAPDDAFWQIKIGDPGVKNQLADPIYLRGAMTLQALRNVVGDKDFFTILKAWAAQHRYRNADISQFIALSQQISGKSLKGFFQNWLYTAGRPLPTPGNGIPPGHPAAAKAPASFAGVDAAAR